MRCSGGGGVYLQMLPKTGEGMLRTICDVLFIALRVLAVGKAALETRA